MPSSKLLITLLIVGSIFKSKIMSTNSTMQLGISTLFGTKMVVSPTFINISVLVSLSLMVGLTNLMSIADEKFASMLRFLQ